jgi:hypothetical protein
MKRRVPINSSMASRIVAEHPSIEGVINQLTTITTFTANGVPVLEMEKTFPVDGQELVSYYTYIEEFKQEEGL